MIKHSNKNIYMLIEEQCPKKLPSIKDSHPFHSPSFTITRISSHIYEKSFAIQLDELYLIDIQSYDNITNDKI